jgi:3-methyladenine DNA glycosylase AlkD
MNSILPDAIREACRHHANSHIAAHSRRFFKCGPGEYGEGDLFLGIRVPVLRTIARRFKNVPVDTVTGLLQSKYHEERLVALIIWTLQFQKATPEHRRRIYESYLAHTKWINNWDLVDLSAHKIIGAYLADRSRDILYKLARSAALWDRRIAIISTFFFIQNNHYDDTLSVADILLNDHEDLIHKAVGWMLREIGKRDLPVETAFLESRYRFMPRTMLRYAIEKFDEPLRQNYLKGLI